MVTIAITTTPYPQWVSQDIKVSVQVDKIPFIVAFDTVTMYDFLLSQKWVGSVIKFLLRGY